MTSLLTTFASLLYKTNRFHVAVRLFSDRSQKTPKCDKNISDTLGCASCATFYHILASSVRHYWIYLLIGIVLQSLQQFRLDLTDVVVCKVTCNLSSNPALCDQLTRRQGSRVVTRLQIAISGRSSLWLRCQKMLKDFLFVSSHLNITRYKNKRGLVTRKPEFEAGALYGRLPASLGCDKTAARVTRDKISIRANYKEGRYNHYTWLVTKQG